MIRTISCRGFRACLGRRIDWTESCFFHCFTKISSILSSSSFTIIFEFIARVDILECAVPNFSKQQELEIIKIHHPNSSAVLEKNEINLNYISKIPRRYKKDMDPLF